MKLKVMSLLLVVAILISGCEGLGDRPTGIGKEPGLGQGTISNLDPLNNGLFQVWIFGDSTYVYCTLDKALAEKARTIMRETDASVYYTYRDWKADDLEYTTFDTSNTRISSTCGQFRKGTFGSKLLTVDLIGSQ